MLKLIILGFYMPIMLTSLLLARHIFYTYVMESFDHKSIILDYLMEGLIFFIHEIIIIDFSFISLGLICFQYVLPIATFFLGRKRYANLNFILTPLIVFGFLKLKTGLVSTALIQIYLKAFFVWLTCWLIVMLKNIGFFGKFSLALSFINIFNTVITFFTLRNFYSIQDRIILFLCILFGTALIIIFIYAYLRDLKRRREMKKQITYDSLHDRLTNLLNYRAFSVFVSEQTSQDDLTILMIDIDNFKNLNDQYGHIVGNQILRFFANKLNSTFLKEYKYEVFIYRFGGEEFCVIIRDISVTDCYQTVLNLKKVLKEHPFRLKTHQKIDFSFSGGIARSTKTIHPRDALRYADTLLYQAKKSGKAKVNYGEEDQG
ncbi:GGDEF domain-containing protein [Liquorilactobacillus vini]|uniref:Signal transduction diguanylate cyclase n=1 Tax=Liquorilactobacillus vini DSM 20605 TaxID=1133569 RepID=A0A0R2CD77_9LACO|nr:GGDEF domain-containing protein [Liquorilactobacillus vini]KRM89306.1 Signal transduction diguanylate cyclase [Liquorilactobacillus vini DSM 20605]